MISAQNFISCCENSGVKRGGNPTGGPYPTYPVMLSAQAKKEYTCGTHIVVAPSYCAVRKCEQVGAAAPGHGAAGAC